jgi:outer membrane autotransporter protein
MDSAFDKILNNYEDNTLRFGWIPFYRNVAIDTSIEDNIFGIKLGVDYSFNGGSMVFGAHGNFDRHSIVERENKAKMNSLGFNLYSGFISNKFDIQLALGFGRSNFELNRNSNYKSKFAGNVFNLGTKIVTKFKITNHLQLRPFLGVQMSRLAHGNFDENGSGLRINAGSYNLAMANFGITFLSGIGPLNLQLVTEGKYRILDKPIAVSSTLGDVEYESRETKNPRFLFGMAVGLNYKITEKITLGTNLGYQRDGSKNILDTICNIKINL